MFELSICRSVVSKVRQKTDFLDLVYYLTKSWYTCTNESERGKTPLTPDRLKLRAWVKLVSMSIEIINNLSIFIVLLLELLHSSQSRIYDLLKNQSN